MSSAALKEAMAILAASELESPALAPSKLGTKAHWDDVYEREVRMHQECGDEGEVWFGEDSSDAMRDWALENVPDRAVRVLDVGSGNGQLSFLFHAAGYVNLSGCDFSPASIELSIAIAKERSVVGIEFLIRDVIRGEMAKDGVYGLICDKGTYDAISLSDELIDGAALNSVYPGKIAGLLSPEGIFLITSCNWTRSELERAFVTEGTGLKYHSHIPQPSFSFGGAQGQTITTVAFCRV